MAWIDEMKKDAVAVAFPEFELEADDEIIFETQHEEGYRYSSYTYEDPSFAIMVTVYRGGQTMRYASFENSGAREFMLNLMRKGS